LLLLLLPLWVCLPSVEDPVSLHVHKSNVEKQDAGRNHSGCDKWKGHLAWPLLVD
jgi:hypothetical protein